MHKYIKNRLYEFLKKEDRNEDALQNMFKGKDLKKIRLNYNLSQRCFAVMLNISVKTLQNYEVDRYAIPGAARSLFVFADENIDLFRKYYLKKVDNLEPYRKSMNK